MFLLSKLATSIIYFAVVIVFITYNVYSYSNYIYWNDNNVLRIDIIISIGICACVAIRPSLTASSKLDMEKDMHETVGLIQVKEPGRRRSANIRTMLIIGVVVAVLILIALVVAVAVALGVELSKGIHTVIMCQF